MKYTKEERLEVGRQICEAGISNLEAAHRFNVSEESARRYRLLYEESEGIIHITDRTHKSTPDTLLGKASETDYESMTKEELIQELMNARIREARLKKGYMVKGDGAKAEYILLDNKNTK